MDLRRLDMLSLVADESQLLKESNSVDKLAR